MPWVETDEHNKRLLSALTELAAERGALERLAGAINADRRATTLDAARRGDKHQERKDVIVASTLTRWQQEGIERIANAQPHKKRLVYEFLERSENFRTSIYNPAPSLPQGLAAFVAAQKETFAHLRFERLANLDGIYRLYRRAWTTPDRHDRVLVSRLSLETVEGLTRYREEQDYRDDARGGMPVQERDEGVVFISGTNLFLFGFGKDEPRVKFFAAHAWRPMIDGTRPVYELKGTVIGVGGEGPHSSTPFIAYRADDPEFASGIASADTVDPEINAWIGCEAI